MRTKPLSFLIAGALLTAGAAGASPQPPAEGAKGKRVGDPYALATCPISGGKLGSMGDPIVQVYEGREVRFCCDSCPPKFEKDLAKSWGKLDETMIKDQLPLYPLDTSVVSGTKLGEKPLSFVYANRLVRVVDEAEKSAFLKDPKKHLGELNKAVIAAQGKDYPLKTCPVSGEEFGGEMGKPVDVVMAGRLVRLCCGDCKGDLEKDPARYVAMVDAARKGAKPEPAGDHKHDHGK